MVKLAEVRQIHIVGIGGAGMSAIARVLKARGFAVQGSDRSAGRLVADLRAEGIPVTLGHAAENLGAADVVLASSAISAENVELQAARARGIPVLRRPDFLPLLLEGYDVIAVAGAHGKTTVTGMIATVLLAAGLDPSYIIGGVVGNLGSNARSGSGPHFVIEADEYRNTFLALEPTIAVVTNVEFDHPDSFASPRFLRLAFGEFTQRIRPGGTLIACHDDPVAHAIAAAYHASQGRVTLYGLAEGQTSPGARSTCALTPRGEWISRRSSTRGRWETCICRFRGRTMPSTRWRRSPWRRSWECPSRRLRRRWRLSPGPRGVLKCWARRAG